MQQSTIKKIIISGGGTGGHIYPAVAVAQELQKRIPDIEILFVGASDRMEMEKVPKAGYKIIGLWISGIQRSLSFKNLLWPIKVVLSVIKSFRILNQFKPDVCIGFGGYASGALLYAATIKKIPTLIHEQNSYAGITNKILKNRVYRICVAYNNMEKFFPASKIMLTGNPVRNDLLDVKHFREKAMAHFGLQPSKKTILIIGGSLGARTINEAIMDGIQTYTQNDIQILWQTGKSFYPKAKTVESSNVIVREFIYEMNLAYAIADVVISRAGALSIAELAQVQKPVILIPSPNVAEDHQTKNAMALVEREAALFVKDSEAKKLLVQSSLDLIQNEMKQMQLKNNISSFAMPNAAISIVDEILVTAKQAQK